MLSQVEKYNEIYQRICRLNEEIENPESAPSSTEELSKEEIIARIENLKNTLAKIRDYMNSVEAYIQIAEMHLTSKNLPVIEAPAGYRVNLERLRKWSLLIDPLSGDTDDDPYAKRLYLVANCDKVFLERKKEEFAEKMKCLEDELAFGTPDRISRLNEEIDNCRSQILDILSSDEFVMSVSQDFGEDNTEELDAGIYSFLFQIISRSSAGSKELYFIDAWRENSSFINNVNEIEGDFEWKTANDSEAIHEMLDEIVLSFADTDTKIENYNSVSEYNADVSDDKIIKKKVIVIIGGPELFDENANEQINSILYNHRRYGVSLILVQISENKEAVGFDIPEYLQESQIRIQNSVEGTFITFGSKQPKPFAW